MHANKLQSKFIRKLMIALTASGILNIILISSFFYWLIKDTPPSPYFEKKPLTKIQSTALTSPGTKELIHSFRSLTFNQLANKLSNQELVEDGFSERDIALGCLVAFHNFDVSRALLGHDQPAQQRSLIYGRLKSGEPAAIDVYTGLTEQQYQAIKDFATTERWPLTSKGLFWQLKKKRHDAPVSLIDAFSMTSEFLAVEMLFSRIDSPVSKTDLQNLLLEGTWAMLSTFAEQQKQIQDLSAAKRQRFLLDYIDYKSPTAAYLLLKVDGEFALKKLDDPHVIQLLNLLNEKTPESEKYAKDLLSSPRSDAIWRLASEKLYFYAGEAIPEKNLHHQAMQRFHIGQSTLEPVIEKIPAPKINKTTPPKKKPEVAAAPPPLRQPMRKDRLYIVQEGDSLWKIARRFNVDVEHLRAHNKLKSDALKPGTPIRIP